MTRPRRAWREPMVWLVFGLPLASVLAAIGLLVAMRGDGADASIDPVRRTAQIQIADLGPDARAQALRLTAIVRIDEGLLEVLPVSGAFVRDQPLTLRLGHPTLARLDRTLELAPTATGWRVMTDVDTPHDWKLQLAPRDGQWRLHGRLPRNQRAAHLGPALEAK